MVSTILVPLDGSALAELALAYVTPIANSTGARLILFHARPAIPFETDTPIDLDATVARLQAKGIAVDARLGRSYRDEETGRAICEAAREHQATMIGMSTHGHGGLGRVAFGSVADQVLRQTELPILLVPRRCEKPWPVDQPPRFLITLDGSELSEAVLVPASLLATELDAELHLLRVAESSQSSLYSDTESWYPPHSDGDLTQEQRYLETLATDPRLGGRSAAVQAMSGDCVASIMRVTHDQHINLIALATHGRGGLSRLTMGSIATALVERSDVPLLIVRAQSEKQERASNAGVHQSRPTPSSTEPAGETSPAERETRPTEAAPMDAPKTILLALDCSPRDLAVATEVAELARSMQANVVLVNVVQPRVDQPTHPASTSTEAMDLLLAERQACLNERAHPFSGLPVTSIVEKRRHGEETDECIARLTREQGASIVVVASKRSSGLAGLFLGSVAQGVLRLSPCPVLVVRSE